jgi:hypothetical protein
MSDPAITVLFVIAAILLVLVWTLYLVVGLMLGLTAFVIGLPLLLFILMFIMVPPPFIVLLVGGFFVLFGLTGRPKASDSGKPIDGASESGHTSADSEQPAKK